MGGKKREKGSVSRKSPASWHWWRRNLGIDELGILHLSRRGYSLLRVCTSTKFGLFGCLKRLRSLCDAWRNTTDLSVLWLHSFWTESLGSWWAHLDLLIAFLFYFLPKESKSLFNMIELVYHQLADRDSVLYTAQKKSWMPVFPVPSCHAFLNSAVQVLFRNSIILMWYQVLHPHHAMLSVTGGSL